jgi:hypothetical protein
MGTPPVLQDHAHGALADLWGKLSGLTHGYTVSKVGAVIKPVVVQSGLAALAQDEWMRCC